MTINGKISRLVPADPQNNAPEKIYVLPDDPGDLRYVDGSRRTATGEIPVVAAHADHEIGDEFSVELPDPPAQA